ncbi:polysaccharide biosynthesis C-terminal domain-containing protein, partial [Pseudomonadales bacterium]|nr:polysaccharide biosynthesis C-terminal domain-containing protein [Pseudomonadales bacterium]
YTAPVMGIIWTVREHAIVIVLGDQWLGVAPILAWLAPVGFFQSLVSTSGTVLNSIGRSDILRNLGIIGNVFLVSSIVVGLQWGTVGVAACYCIANFIWVYPVIRTVLKQLSIKFTSFLLEVMPFVLAALSASILARLFASNIMMNVIDSILAMSVLTSSLFICIYIAGLWFCARAKLESRVSMFAKSLRA